MIAFPEVSLEEDDELCVCSLAVYIIRRNRNEIELKFELGFELELFSVFFGVAFASEKTKESGEDAGERMRAGSPVESLSFKKNKNFSKFKFSLEHFIQRLANH